MSITDQKLNLSRTIRQTAQHRGFSLPGETVELYARRWLVVLHALAISYGCVAGRIATGELTPSDFPQALAALEGKVAA